MKNFFKALLLLLIELILLVIGLPIFALVAIIGVVYTFIKHSIKLDYSIEKQFTPIIRSANLAADGLANAGGGELLNDIFKVKNEIIRYGKWYETISAITGLLKIYERDLWLRRFLKILGKNHCEEAPTEMQLWYYEYKHSVEKENK